MESLIDVPNVVVLALWTGGVVVDKGRVYGFEFCVLLDPNSLLTQDHSALLLRSFSVDAFRIVYDLSE